MAIEGRQAERADCATGAAVCPGFAATSTTATAPPTTTTSAAVPSLLSSTSPLVGTPESMVEPYFTTIVETRDQVGETKEVVEEKDASTFNYFILMHVIVTLFKK